MVLSNKKLKQKIRSLLAESVAAAESRDAAKAEDAKQQLQGVKEILSSKNHRGDRPTRRGGKRRKPSSSVDDPKPADGGTEDREGAGDVGDCVDLNDKKKKKRKRGEGRGSDSAAESTVQKQEKPKRVEVEDGGKKQKEKKKKKMMMMKQKKKQKEKEGEGNGEMVKNGNESGRSNGGGNEEAEAAVINTCVENSDAMKKVYVGGIPYYSTEDDIRSFFESCGTITEVDCMYFPESGKFRGIAILTFKTEAAAKRALALDGADMGGLFLKIQPFKATQTQKADFSPEVIDGYYRIYAGNLSWDIAEEDLRQLFSDCKITSIRFGEDKATSEFKGYAHVDFKDSQSHAVALELDQKVVCGRPVRIRCAVPKKGADAKMTPKPVASNGDGGGGGGNATSEVAKSEGNVDGCAGSGDGKKKKRQTCYVCGVPGHLSSTCPQRKADGGGGDATSGVADSKGDLHGFADSEGGKKKKKKRQTCYVCGVPGHLSSSCPQKQV